MDSTDFNKIAGAAIGALLVFLLLNFFSGQIYGTRDTGGHHGDEVLAFALAVETEAAGEAAEEPQVDYLTLVAAADPGAGEGVFRACSACHKLEDGANAVGPHLFDVVGRDIAAVEGYSYSDALAAVEGGWTLEALSGFLEDPKGWAPGTKMSYAGLDDPHDRVNLIAYLNEVGGTPVDLAEGLEPIAAVADAGTDIPDPALSVGVGPGPGVVPPAEAGDGAPASGESAGIEAPSEAAAVEESAEATAPDEEAAAADEPAAPVVTEVTPVDPTREGAEAPTSPAAQTHRADRTGEDIIQTPDPSPEAPAQQSPGTVGAPGQETPPLAGAPDAADAEEDAATPGQAAPAERVEGEDAPPQTPPGQAPEREAAVTGAEPAAPAQGGGEVETTPSETTEADPATATDQQMAAAPAEPAATAAGGGDAAAGEQIFRRCIACHKMEEGQHGIGPSLHGVVGRDVAAVEGYAYSDAMAAHEGEWTVEHLSAYLENPKAVVPGTKMVFAGLRDEQDRLDVIAYLQEAGGTQ